MESSINRSLRVILTTNRAIKKNNKHNLFQITLEIRNVNVDPANLIKIVATKNSKREKPQNTKNDIKNLFNFNSIKLLFSLIKFLRRHQISNYYI